MALVLRRAASRYFIVDTTGFAAAYAMPPQGDQQQPPSLQGPSQQVGAKLGPCIECSATGTRSALGASACILVLCFLGLMIKRFMVLSIR